MNLNNMRSSLVCRPLYWNVMGCITYAKGHPANNVFVDAMMGLINFIWKSLNFLLQKYL